LLLLLRELLLVWSKVMMMVCPNPVVTVGIRKENKTIEKNEF